MSSREVGHRLGRGSVSCCFSCCLPAARHENHRRDKRKAQGNRSCIVSTKGSRWKDVEQQGCVFDVSVGSTCALHPCANRDLRADNDLYRMLSIRSILCFDRQLSGWLIVSEIRCIHELLTILTNDVVPRSPFLRNVKNATTFDTQLSRYVNTTYVQLK